MIHLPDCQRLRCSEEAQDEIMFSAVLLEIPNTGSGPINSDAAACLASLSAISLPGTLLCPGTKSKRTLLKVESLPSADLVSAQDQSE